MKTISVEDLKAKIDAAPKIMGGKYDFVFAEGCICCERNSELLEVEAKKNNIAQLAELENFIFEKEKISSCAGIFLVSIVTKR